eukprot:CAMPEP_0168743370 /NCGR_PEP_ID=MMETSP0724-20121128/13542_1 /TAXON_ID=265536 /ORGANISM="Amphiprora sp., Strain CCMP467" /LENGTH=606 /DNA_ID=CAMNT_0008790999 /DNA_START=99 /DNA_END=1919 /DNA_ORIENTATION=-
MMTRLHSSHHHLHRMTRSRILILRILLSLTLMMIPTAHGFANYMLSDTNCLMDLDPSEVIMNHPVEAAVTDAPLQIQIDNLPPTWKLGSTLLEPEEDPDADLHPPPMRPILMSGGGNDDVTFPLSLKVRVHVNDAAAAADFQYVLQLGGDSENDHDDGVHFESGSCDNEKRTAGRDGDVATLIFTKAPDSSSGGTPIQLWGGWASGHEAVKLLYGFQFQFQESSSSSSSQEEKHHPAETKASQEDAQLSWSDYVVSQKGCSDNELKLDDNTSIQIQSAKDPFPKELVVVKERDEDAVATLEIDLAPVAAAASQQMGTVVFFVTTSLSDGTRLTGDSATARWMSDHAACARQDRLLVTRGVLPAVLQIPTLNEERVTIHVHALYDVSSKDHGQMELYRTQPLVLHWSTSQQQEQRQELERQEKEDDDEEETREEDIRRALQQNKKDDEEGSNNKNEKPDPQRDLDKKISQDLREHLQQLKAKEQGRQRQKLERDALNEKYRSKDKKHVSHMSSEERKTVQDWKGHETDPIVKHAIDKHKQRHEEAQKHKKNKRHHSSKEDDLENEIPVVLWQDSSYYMGLIVLVGGIYGTILLMPFLSKLVATKRRE